MLSFTQPSSDSSSSLPGSDDSDEHVCTILYCLDRFGVSDHFYHELSMGQPLSSEVVHTEVIFGFLNRNNFSFLQLSRNNTLRNRLISSCLSCRGKVKTIGTSNVIGECTKCCLKVKMSRCAKSKSAKIVIASNSLPGKMWHLTAFNEQLEAMIDGIAEGESIEEKLMLGGEVQIVTNPLTRIVKQVIN